MDNNPLGILFVILSISGFYYATMEQYFTGVLILQVVNGVDEGSILNASLALVAAIYGPTYFPDTKVTFSLVHGSQYTLALG